MSDMRNGGVSGRRARRHKARVATMLAIMTSVFAPVGLAGASTKVPPSVPQNVYINSHIGRLSVFFNNSAKSGDSKMKHYTVSAKPGVHTCTVTPPFATMEDCDLKNLQNNVTYSITVTATNGNNETSKPTAPVLAVPGVPEPVAGTSVTRGDGVAVVSWSNSVSDSAAPIKKYVATATPSGQSCTTSPTVYSCTITGLTDGTLYTVSVQAYDRYGASPIYLPQTVRALHWVSVPRQQYGDDQLTSDGTHLWQNANEIDPATGKVIESLADPSIAGAGVAITGVVSDGTYAYANDSNEAISKFNIATDSLVKTTVIGNAGDTGTPGGGILLADGYLWVINASVNQLDQVDPSTLSVLSTSTVGGGAFSITADANDIWVANKSSNSVTEVSASTNTVVTTITGINSPESISDDGTNVWVTKFLGYNQIGNGIVQISASTGVVVATLPMTVAGSVVNGTPAYGVQPVRLASDGSHVWVSTDNGGIWVYVIATGKWQYIWEFFTGLGMTVFEHSVWIENVDGGTFDPIAINQYPTTSTLQ